jgi:hypothetical protein
VIEAGPALTAYREEEEPWRIERLRRVSRYLKGLPILSLNDSKGTLTVDWARIPSTECLFHVAKCWVCECEWHSIHLVEGVMFFEDYPLDTVDGT